MTNTQELYWTAGFLEGEGTFYFKKAGKPSEITIAAVQVQKEPLERLMTYFGGSCYVWNPNESERYQHKNWQPQWTWRLNGYQAAAVMMTLYVLMSPKRQEQISAALTHWRSTKPQRRPKTSPVCLRGHVLSVVGLTARGTCKVCRRKEGLAAYYRRKERLKTVELVL